MGMILQLFPGLRSVESENKVASFRGWQAASAGRWAARTGSEMCGRCPETDRDRQQLQVHSVQYYMFSAETSKATLTINVLTALIYRISPW